MLERPNILVLLCDQLRRQALGCYGDPDARTPHLDAFAQRGVRFVNACLTYPICVPFRFTLMTGEYAHVRKVPGIEYAMATAERTLADEFNEAGYETVYVGKWHLDGGHGRLGSAVQVNRTPIPRNRGEVWRGIRTRRYKYTVTGDNMGGRPWQFFDLETDPWEMHNLIEDDDHRDEIARHHRMLCDRLVETHDHFVLMPSYGCDGVNCWEGIAEG